MEPKGGVSKDIQMFNKFMISRHNMITLLLYIVVSVKEARWDLTEKGITLDNIKHS